MPCSGFSLPQISSNPWATGLPQTTGRQSGLVGGGFPLCHVFKAIPCHHHPTIHAAFEVWNTRAMCERSVSPEHESLISLLGLCPAHVRDPRRHEEVTQDAGKKGKESFLISSLTQMPVFLCNQKSGKLISPIRYSKCLSRPGARIQIEVFVALSCSIGQYKQPYDIQTLRLVGYFGMRMLAMDGRVGAKPWVACVGV